MASCCQNLKNRIVNFANNANSEYKVDLDETKELLYFLYWYVNNLYGWAISQIIYQWSQLDQKAHLNLVRRSYKKNIIKTETKNFFAGMNIKYIKQLYRLYDDLPILPEKNK